MLDSVTVSIADDKNGIFNFTLLVRLCLINVSEGNTDEYLVQVVHHQMLKTHLLVPYKLINNFINL